mgnify:CR=1 FL=1
MGLKESEIISKIMKAKLDQSWLLTWGDAFAQAMERDRELELTGKQFVASLAAAPPPAPPPAPPAAGSPERAPAHTDEEHADPPAPASPPPASGDDDDLMPLQPLVAEASTELAEGDVVWAWYRNAYWPAKVTFLLAVRSR